MLFLSAVLINVLSDFSLLYYTRESRISPASQAVVNTLRQKHNKQLLLVPRHVLTRSARSTAVARNLVRAVGGGCLGLFLAFSRPRPSSRLLKPPHWPRSCPRNADNTGCTVSKRNSSLCYVYPKYCQEWKSGKPFSTINWMDLWLRTDAVGV